MNALIIAALLAAGHDEKSGAACDHPAGAPAAQATSSGVVLRGAKLAGLAPTPMSTLLESPASFDGKTVAVEAQVRRACSRKGCWMELAQDESAPGVRVTFKDYGFFVPLDSAGKKAKVEGTVTVATLSAEKAEHLKAEGARVARGKDGAYREVQLVASGVELR